MQAHQEHPEEKDLREALRTIQSALDTCEARFRNIIDRNTDGIVIIDAEGRVRFVNPAAEQLLARTSDDLLGEAFGFPVIAGETTEIDILPGKRDLPFRVAEIRVEETEWQGERAYLTSLRDITERKQAEEAIEKLARFPAENPNPVLRVSQEGHVLYANSAAAPLLETWNCQKGDLLPKKWRQFTRNTLNAGVHQDRELKCDGRTYSLVFAPVAEHGYINIYGLDITQRKETAVALWESQQMLRLIMDHIPQSIFWKDKASIYLGCNRAFAEDAGVDDPEAIVGKSDFDLPWIEQAEQYRTDDQRVMETGESRLRYEEPQTTPTGEMLCLQTSKIPLCEVSGEVIGVLGMYEDITARKQAELRLQQYTTRLETLHQIDQAILEARSTEEVAGAALRGLKALIEVQDLSVMLFDADREYAEVLRIHGGQGLEIESTKTPLSWFRPLDTLRRGEVYVVEDLEAVADPTPVEHRLLAHRVRSCLSLPLMRSDELIGAVNLAAEHPRAFTETDVEIVREVADQLVIALQQSRLHEQVQRHAEALERRVEARTAELRKMVDLMAGREIRMTELKDVIKQLRQQLTDAGLEPLADDPLLSKEL
jgi:PAS domain S-box-containing protein